MSFLCIFAEVYTCLTFLSLGPSPIAFIEHYTIDIQNVTRFSYLNQYPLFTLIYLAQGGVHDLITN